MTTRVHPSAVVEPGSELADGVRIGPFCVVESGVRIGADTELVSNVVVRGPGQLGERNLLHPGVVVGGPPQDLGYRGEPTRFAIGDDNVLHEQVTVHRGTVKDEGLTRLGNRNLLMVGAHVAHDCRVGSDVVLVNYVSLGGHVHVGDGAAVGGYSAAAPFTRIGELAYLSGGSMLEQDLPPYLLAGGNRARIRMTNRVGLRRGEVPPESHRALEQAFRRLYRSSSPIAVAAEALRSEAPQDAYVQRLLDFILRP